MKSTESQTYVANFFLHNFSRLHTIFSKIDKIHITEYEKKHGGRTYVTLTIDATLNADEELSDEECQTLNRWDNTLDIYCGKLSDYSHIAENEKTFAYNDVANIKQLFDGFGCDVEYERIADDKFGVKNLSIINEFKKTFNFV